MYLNFNPSFINKGLMLYGGLLHVKVHSIFFINFVLILAIIILGLNSFFPRKVLQSDNVSNTYNLSNLNFKSIFNREQNKDEYIVSTYIYNKMSEQYRIIEYPLIILFSLTGTIFLIVSSDIVSIFLSIELQSYGLYLLCSIYRNSEASVSAGLTYFLLGGLSSCIILLGLCLLYVNTGSTNLEYIFTINSINNAFFNSTLVDSYNISILSDIYTQSANYQLPFAIISVGLLFKIASAPFHFWSPDVYDAIPTLVTTYVAIIAKVSILVLLLEFTYYTDNLIYPSWSNILVFSSILSLLTGSILGLTQSRIKRLFAFSTISHLGFLLLTLSINSMESYKVFLFYITQYSLSNLNAFIILITIGYSLFNYTSNNNNSNFGHYSPIQLISQLKGFNVINPMLSLSFAITLFSFIGVPPLAGFFAKQMVLSSALDKGYILMVMIGIITSVISAVYYLAIIKVIYFETTEYNLNIKYLDNINNKVNIKIKQSNIVLSSYMAFIIAFLSMLIFMFIFYDFEIYTLINTICIFF
jgi:NADH-ubiquinone oxidoreductase chain 2